MTGFGWDPSHSIVKARQEGLQTVLYKPFRADRLMEAVEQALRHPPAPAAGPRPPHDGRNRGRAPPTGHAPANRPPPRPRPPARRATSRPSEASHHES